MKKALLSFFSLVMFTSTYGQHKVLISLHEAQSNGVKHQFNPERKITFSTDEKYSSVPLDTINGEEVRLYFEKVKIDDEGSISYGFRASTNDLREVNSDAPPDLLCGTQVRQTIGRSLNSKHEIEITLYLICETEEDKEEDEDVPPVIAHSNNPVPYELTIGGISYSKNRRKIKTTNWTGPIKGFSGKYTDTIWSQGKKGTQTGITYKLKTIKYDEMPSYILELVIVEKSRTGSVIRLSSLKLDGLKPETKNIHTVKQTISMENYRTQLWLNEITFSLK